MPTAKKKSDESKKPGPSRNPNKFYVGSIEGKSDAETNAILAHKPALRATCGGSHSTILSSPEGMSPKA